MRIRYIFALLAGMLSFCMTPAASTVSSDKGTDWKLYSAFHNNPHRIMDGERFTYFFVYQQNYNSTSAETTWGIPCGTLFFYDKQSPADGIRPLHERIRLNDSRIGVADYNSRAGYLVVCYSDGGIDLAYDNGDVIYITELKDRINQRQSAVTCISFDLDNDIWIGLKNGFMHIDGTTGKVIEAPEFGVAVNSIVRVGDRVVAWMGGQIYDAPADADLNDVYVFEKTGEGSNRAPRSFMPLNDTTFAFVGNIGSIGAGSVFLAKYANGKWTSIPAISDNLAFTSLAANCSFGNSLENNVVVNRDGYLLFNRDYIYQVNLGLTETGTLSFSKRSLLWKSMSVYGSWDFENFWYFTNPGKFCMKRADGFGNETTWTNVIADTPTEGPRAFRRLSLTYSPEYGFLSVNRGKDFRGSFNARTNPALLSGFKNGEWTDYSPYYFKPSFDTSGARYNKTYYPVNDPYTLYVDPLFPQYAYMGSFWDGLVALNLDNPSGPALHWASADNISAGLPGFSAIFPRSTWLDNGTNKSSVCSVKVAGFDGDDNLWIFYSNAWNAEGYKFKMDLMCLTPDARREMLETQDIAKCGKWNILPVDHVTTGVDEALALKHPKNQNKLIVFTSHGDRSVGIYDHKGTIADTSDDELVLFAEVINPFGGRTYFGSVCDFLEDPVSGDVYIASEGGVVAIDVNAQLVNGVMPARYLSFKGPGGSTQYVGMSSYVLDLCMDEYNRLWVSTYTDGVIGVNAERNGIVAHYTAENSGLPDNHVYATCWDPSQQRLFISTDKGLASVKPDAPVGSVSSTALKAYPAMVDENYAGTVTVYNVSGVAAVKVKNSKNTIVATLPAAVDNMTYWNLLDDSGKAVPSGRYTIYDANGFIDSMEIVVVRK